MEAPLNIIEEADDLIRRAYLQGWDDRGRFEQITKASVKPQVEVSKTLSMTSEVDESLSYKERFLAGRWPTDVSDEIKAISCINLRLNARPLNALYVAVASSDDEFVTIGHILNVPPKDIMKSVIARRGLGEKGIKQLLDALCRFGIELQYPSV